MVYVYDTRLWRPIESCRRMLYFLKTTKICPNYIIYSNYLNKMFYARSSNLYILHVLYIACIILIIYFQNLFKHFFQLFFIRCTYMNTIVCYLLLAGLIYISKLVQLKNYFTKRRISQAFLQKRTTLQFPPCCLLFSFISF